MSESYECCASGSCEVCRRPSGGYSREQREKINRERDRALDSYEPPWVRQRKREGWGIR